MAWEGTEALRSEPRVSPLRRFSRKADELFLKVRSETERGESLAWERGAYVGHMSTAKDVGLRVLTDCHPEGHFS